MNQPDFQAPQSEQREEAAMPQRSGKTTAGHAALMAIEGVEGVGTNQDAIGNQGIVVYVRDAEAAKRIPKVFDGRNVKVEITGPINALPR